MKDKAQSSHSQIIIILSLTVAFLIELVGGFRPIFQARDYVAKPLQYFYASFNSSLQNGVESIFGASSLREENIKLRMRVLELEQELAQEKDGKLLCSFAEEENKKNSELGIKKGITALIIDKNAGLSAGTILIDKGINDNIQKDDIVIANGVFLGQVIETHTFTALVKTIYMQGYTIKGFIPARKITTLLNYNNSTLIASEILRNEEVTAGDIVHAKPIDAKPSFPVGKVISFSNDTADDTKTAILSSLIDLKDISIVTIVIE